MMRSDSFKGHSSSGSTVSEHLDVAVDYESRRSALSPSSSKQGANSLPLGASKT